MVNKIGDEHRTDRCLGKPQVTFNSSDLLDLLENVVRMNDQDAVLLLFIVLQWVDQLLGRALVAIHLAVHLENFDCNEFLEFWTKDLFPIEELNFVFEATRPAARSKLPKVPQGIP